MMKNVFFRSLMLLFMSAPLWAQGFSLYEQGVQGQGNAGAFTARAEDSTALFYNPAGLAQLGSSEVNLAGKFTTSRAYYSNAGQTTWHSDFAEDLHPSLFYNTKLGKVAIGVGSTVTAAYEVDWNQPDYQGRFLYNRTDFRAREHMLGAAYGLTDTFSIGGSVRFVQLDYAFGAVRPRPFSSSDPSRYFEADETYDLDGDGTGFSFGMQYHKLRRFSIGLNYQSAIDVDLSGRRLFTQTTELGNPSAEAAFEQFFHDGGASTSFELPERIAVGYSTRVTVRTRAELDVIYEGWSRENTTIDTTDAAGAAQQVVIPRRWNDTYSVRIGADFQQRRALLWRLGMGTTRSTVPSDTFQPDFPDYDRFFYSFGVSYTLAKRYTIEGAWQLVQNRDRHVADTELVFDPSSPDYVTSNGQIGLYESQRAQVQLGLRIKLN